jgi:predicted CXXCH cytochrome family protein
MKKMMLCLVAVLAVVVAFGLYSDTTLAFHDGGVAECSGCHSMHSAQSSDKLLVRVDESSTCLNCHQDEEDTGPTRYHVSTDETYLADPENAPLQRTPGGDFGWLRQDLSAPASYGGGYVSIDNVGYTRGHNIIAADFGYTVDPGGDEDGTVAGDTQSPGGTFPNAALKCTSCHDPHGTARVSNGNVITYPSLGSTHDPIFESGSYPIDGGNNPPVGEAFGVYRLLGGEFYAPSTGPTTNYSTFDGVPAAKVPDDYNRNEDVTQTRVSYGWGDSNGYTSWSNWCGNCHAAMHNPGSSQTLHPTDAEIDGLDANYNAYVQTGDLTGVIGSAYTSLVPFALSTSDPDTLAAKALNDDTDLDGPASTDRIACLTCHRAHASGWKYALRWNGEAEFLTLGDPGAPFYPGTDLAADGTNDIGNQGQFNRGYTVAQMEAAYNGRPADAEFAAHQRSLCNKCHVKD